VNIDRAAHARWSEKRALFFFLFLFLFLRFKKCFSSSFEKVTLSVRFRGFCTPSFENRVKQNAHTFLFFSSRVRSSFLIWRSRYGTKTEKLLVLSHLICFLKQCSHLVSIWVPDWSVHKICKNNNMFKSCLRFNLKSAIKKNMWSFILD